MPKKINTDLFLKRVNEKFPNITDDLSKVVYEKSDKKVTFICQKHGEYSMTPLNYLSGQRCPKCKYEKFSERKKRYNDEEFKNKIIEIYGNKYDLSEVHYISRKNKVKIGYKGEWHEIIAGNLLNGHEPKKIANKKIGDKNRLTLEDFISKAVEKYGMKYDYSKSIYVDSHTPLCVILHEIDPITDKEYGEFFITPNKHLSGGEHPKLSGKGYTREEIIYYLNKIHNNRYDYSLISANNKIKQPIICPIHGVFYQTLHHHKSGEGCPQCFGKTKKSNAQFINELKEIYGEKYDLSRIEYKNAKEKVTFGCYKHGFYSYLPSQLLSGSGCKFCKSSISENEIEVLLGKNNIEYVSQCNCRTFKWLGLQSFDFYLPKMNIAIECQGCQHFRPIKAFKGEETFQKVLKRDEEKRKKCIVNNVKLVYYTNEHTIPSFIKDNFYIYTDKNKLIKDIINNEVNDIYYGTTDTEENKRNKT